MKLFAVLGVLGLSCLVGLVACSSSDDGDKTTTPTPGVPSTGTDAGAAQCSADVAAPETRAGACPVTIASPGLQEPASKHIPAPANIEYCTNPPSSGPHYPEWAEFKEYAEEVDWGYLVHSEEHGAVLLLYKCETPCPDVVEALRAVRDRAAADPTCDAQGRPGTKRIIVAPSKTIPTKVAAAAWSATYTAECVDGPSLDEFVRTKGQRGPEDLCFAGQIFP